MRGESGRSAPCGTRSNGQRAVDHLRVLLVVSPARRRQQRGSLLRRHRHGTRSSQCRFWLLLGSALGAWTFAEVIWGVYDLVLNTAVPVPSLADVGYLGAIPLAAAALLCHRSEER